MLHFQFARYGRNFSIQIVWLGQRAHKSTPHILDHYDFLRTSFISVNHKICNDVFLILYVNKHFCEFMLLIPN